MRFKGAFGRDRKRGRLSLKVVSLCVCICLTASVFSGAVSAADDIDDMRDRYNELEQEAANLQIQIDSASSELADKTVLRDWYKEQIFNIQEQLDLLNAEIAECNSQINDCNEQIAQKEQDIADNYELFKQRLRAMYMTGTISNLEILLGSSSLSDYIARSELVASISEHDRELMESLEDDIASINADKAIIEANLAQVAEAQKQQSIKFAQMDSYYTELNSVIAELESDVAYYESELGRVEAAKSQQDAEIDAALENIRNSGGGGTTDGGASYAPPSAGVVGEGSFIWPTPGYYTIWSPYGYRDGSMHNGIDISGGGIYGAPIVASKSGTVTYTQFYRYEGYGYCLIVDHGDGTMTRYAHCSSIIVGVGQTVSQGQTIAYVGSTGDSTGPHLHFEVYVNGSRINPVSAF